MHFVRQPVSDEINKHNGRLDARASASLPAKRQTIPHLQARSSP